MDPVWEGVPSVRPSICLHLTYEYMTAIREAHPTERSEACSEQSDEVRGYELHFTQTEGRT